jgi:hypothetical protein
MPIYVPGKVVLAQNYTPIDWEAADYARRVEAADGQPLESGVFNAYNAFALGCKADGIWNAIKASCILAGARTLSGALVPLVGAAPTPFFFVAGDYNRKTGLAGDGSTKYLDCNRANNADPQNSQHMSVRVNTRGAEAIGTFIGDITAGQTGASYIYRNSINNVIVSRSRDNTETVSTSPSADQGFIGISRAASGSYTLRRLGSNQAVTQASFTPTTGNVHLFKLNGSTLYTSSRINFYSIGEALTLSLLESRVTTLINAIAAAIP